MVSEKMAKMLNDQIDKEFYSAYLYLSIANYYEDQDLDGFANWYTIQAQEERDHAMLFRSYLINDGTRVHMGPIDAPTADFANVKAPMEAGLEHEKFITNSINEIYAAALAEHDYKTLQFLDWFVKEQGEEEKNASDLCKKYELFGHDPKGLYLLNSEYAARVYSAPSLVLD